MGVTTTVCIAVFCGLFVKALGDLPIYELDFLLSRDLSLQNLCEFAAKGVPCDRQIYNHNVADTSQDDVDYSNQIQSFARRIRRRLTGQSPNEHIQRSVDSLLSNSRSVENIYELVHTGTFHNRQGDCDGPENQPIVFTRHHRASRGRSRSMSHPNIGREDYDEYEGLTKDKYARRLREVNAILGGEDYDEYEGHTMDKHARRLRELNALLDLASKTISLQDLGDIDYLDLYKDSLLQELNQELLRSKNISLPSFGDGGYYPDPTKVICDDLPERPADLEVNQNFTHTDQNFTENGHTHPAEQNQNITKNLHTRVVQQSQNDTENEQMQTAELSTPEEVNQNLTHTDQNFIESPRTLTAVPIRTSLRIFTFQLLRGVRTLLRLLSTIEDGVPLRQPVRRIIVGGILMNIQQQQQEQIPAPPPNRAHQVNGPSPNSSIANNSNIWLNILFLCVAVLFALIMSV